MFFSFQRLLHVKKQVQSFIHVRTAASQRKHTKPRQRATFGASQQKIRLPHARIPAEAITSVQYVVKRVNSKKSLRLHMHGIRMMTVSSMQTLILQQQAITAFMLKLHPLIAQLTVTKATSSALTVAMTSILTADGLQSKAMLSLQQVIRIQTATVNVTAQAVTRTFQVTLMTDAVVSVTRQTGSQRSSTRFSDSSGSSSVSASHVTAEQFTIDSVKYK